MEQYIDKLIGQMTLEEKIAQMQQISANMADKTLRNKFIEMGTIGSFLHVLGSEVGDYIDPTKSSRLKIPPIFGIDAIHGHALLKEATVFPSQLALACTFDDGLIEEIGYATAKEVCADGLDWVFSPVLCLGRDLRWGRIDETFGEDYYLASRLGSAIIKGYQKDNLVAACAKHYLGYGEATGGRDSYDTEITERYAREIFLKPFKAAVDAGCMTFMTAYGSIDGKPLTASRKWLTEILKDELGFDGFIVTDWDNYKSLVEYLHAAENIEEACVDGVTAGNDMAMFTHDFYENTLKAVKSGKIPESTINESVRRILRVKARLGMLDGTRKRPSKSVIGCGEHRKLNYKAAVESAVLLKNEGILPLKAAKKIAVIGENAVSVRAQYGDWTYFSHPDPKPEATEKDETYTLLKGVREVYPSAEIVWSQGYAISGEQTEDMFEQAVKCAENADTVIAVLGDNLDWNGEGRDIVNPILRGSQIELVKAIKATGKKIICVLVNGKPLVISELEKYCDAVIETFNGGDMCGLAVAKLIKGEENFSGKLPISFPNEVGSHPNYYNQYDHWHGGQYKDARKESLFPFGFGLSYSQFEYSDIRLNKEAFGQNETIKICVEVKNKSDRDGYEIVQLYFKDKVCKMLTPVRQLVDYKKVFIKAGSKAEVAFDLSVSKLGYFDENCIYRVDGGEFMLFVSGNGKDFKEKTFCVTETVNGI